MLLLVGFQCMLIFLLLKEAFLRDPPTPHPFPTNCSINTMLCPIIFNGNTIEITVHTSCYLGLKLTLCYSSYFVLYYYHWIYASCFVQDRACSFSRSSELEAQNLMFSVKKWNKTINAEKSTPKYSNN